VEKQDTASYSILKEGIRLLSGVGGLFALIMAIFPIRGITNWGVDMVTFAWLTFSVMVAGLLIWFSIRGHIEQEVQIIRSGWKWGFIVGGIGFILGSIIIPSIVAIVTSKDQAQGPLFGIFITGPAGFSIGIIIGTLVEIYTKRNKKK